MALHDEEERRKVTYEEARAVLEAQQEIASKVDTKAVRTVRITVVLVGVVFSAWKVHPELFDPTFTFLSVVTLVCSFATGLFTYSESDLFLGPNGEYVSQLADGDFDERSWERACYTPSECGLPRTARRFGSTVDCSSLRRCYSFWESCYWDRPYFYSL